MKYTLVAEGDAHAVAEVQGRGLRDGVSQGRGRSNKIETKSLPKDSKTDKKGPKH